MKAIVNNSCCQILYREKLPRKTVGKTIEVEFSADWEGLAITAVFEAGDVKKDVVYTGKPIIIPHEVLATEGLSVMLGFHGALPDGTIVKRTVPEWLNNVSASLDPSGETSSKPTPDWAAQVQTIALEAKEAADSVRSDAQAGKFNGSAGDDGGWYTPAVTQPDENTLRVAFTPSKEDMPAVADTDITLPAGGGGGGSGEDGGYYTPAVTQTEENTMQVAFTPSKTTMPAVPGTEITLPEGPAGKPGAGGKSAYAYAVEGGYAGTEAEFSAKMAAEIPTVDSTLTKARQAADAAEVGNRLSALSEEIANLQTSGLTTAQVKALDGMFKVAAYIKADVSVEYSAFKTAFGIEDSGDTEPEKTLTSISATYTGGDVAVGTAVSDLTGIVVTAQYSDGTSETVNGYTLSGTIAEGSNTITVSYGGMTTTFAVTGIAESGGDGNGNDPPFDDITWTDGKRISGGGKEYTGHANYSTTDYVNVTGINAITIEISNPNSGNAQYTYEFYDAGKAFVSGGPSKAGYINGNNATYPKSVTIEVPENAIYCRLCGTRLLNVSFFEAVKITVS